MIPNTLPNARHIPSEGAIFGLIGIGFGPSNLALAVAAKEIDPKLEAVFFESRPEFEWHPGMLLDSSRMQISFLKDLATLRNPASPYTFLQYAKAKGRLERFANLREFHPTRIEYQDYLRWVASKFEDQVRYSHTVRKVEPMRHGGRERLSVFRVEVENTATKERATYLARNVVYAGGGKPKVERDGVVFSSRVAHSSDYLARFIPDCEREPEPSAFAVAGDGQSAGEVVADLLSRFPTAQVHWAISGFAPQPSDSSPYVNEVFFSTEADAFYRSSPAKRAAIYAELRDTNYGVIDPDLLGQIYRGAYLDEVKGSKRLFIHRFSKLTSAREAAGRVSVSIEDRWTREATTLSCDGAVLGTGYLRALDPEMFGAVLPHLARDEGGGVALTRQYRAETTTEMDCGLYVQGFGESSHGLGDTLLSLLPFRSQEIIEDIRARSAHAPAVTSAPSGVRAMAGEYPPKRHLETDVERLYAVMERFRFATVISSPPGGSPVVTHVPLILDRSRGAKGVLFGHMDRANPHLELLEHRRTLALFHGPNAYISPHVYKTDNLPTWNSISVHVWGTARIVPDVQSLVRGLMSISEQSDKRPGAYRLDPADARIQRLIDFIVGFEIDIEEMVGRFKLSQDRDDADRERAGRELARQTEAGERALIERVLGLPMATAAE